MQQAVAEFEHLSARYDDLANQVIALETLNLALHQRLQRRPHRAADWLLGLRRR